MIAGPPLSRSQKDFVRADTSIDAEIIDRVVHGFELLVDHDDLEGYKRELMSAAFIIGTGAPKPTAVDVVMTICIRAYADRWHCSHGAARRRLQRMLRPS